MSAREEGAVPSPRPAEGGEGQALSEGEALLLSAYLDGELGPEEQLALERRLALDRSLRDELEKLRRASHEVRAADLAPASGLPQASAAPGGSAKGGWEDGGGPLPLAPALKTPRLRRGLVLATAGLLAVLCLGWLQQLFKARHALEDSGWVLSRSQGTAKVQRGGALLSFQSQGSFQVDDRLHLDQAERAWLAGPEGLQIEVEGPATVRLEQGLGLYVEMGRLRVRADSAAASRALRLRTPDGAVRPAAEGPLEADVEVRPQGLAQWDGAVRPSDALRKGPGAGEAAGAVPSR
jgi:hypothetical protein